MRKREDVQPRKWLVVVELAQELKITEGSNDAIVTGEMADTPPGVIVRGMLSKGFVRNLGEPLYR